jgi:hypothetical protein
MDAATSSLSSVSGNDWKSTRPRAKRVAPEGLERICLGTCWETAAVNISADPSHDDLDFATESTKTGAEGLGCATSDRRDAPEGLAAEMTDIGPSSRATSLSGLTLHTILKVYLHLQHIYSPLSRAHISSSVSGLACPRHSNAAHAASSRALMVAASARVLMVPQTT